MAYQIYGAKHLTIFFVLFQFSFPIIFGGTFKSVRGHAVA
jgi:hypothetical protein